MKRKERIREFWENRIPNSPVLYLADAAKHTKGIISLRTLQRRAADWTLPVIGGPERNTRYYKVLRTDLIEFLCSLDSITGEDRSRARRKPPRKRASSKTKAGGRKTGHSDQKTLFDPEG